MNEVNRTLYIPLYGKALVSRKGILLKDPAAEAIWAAEGFALKAKSRSRWLAYYMAMRAAVFDDWTRKQMDRYPDGAVLHIGCGLDSRIQRTGGEGQEWYDIDFPEVIAVRRKFFRETDSCRMIGADVRDRDWLSGVPRRDTAIVVMEGVSMYLRPEELRALLRALAEHFRQVRLLADCYSVFAAKASRYKNPVREVGVTAVYGVDDPWLPAENTGLVFREELDMTPEHLICQLKGVEQAVFRWLYAGRTAGRLYRLFFYETGKKPEFDK